MTDAEWDDTMDSIVAALGKLIHRITTKDSPSTIYDEVVKIRQALENKVVVSSK